MSEIEDRLRQALASRASSVEPGATDLAALEARVADARRAHTWRVTLLSVAAAVAVVAAVAGALVLASGDDPEELATGTSTSTSSSSTSSSTSSTSTTSTSTTLPPDDGVPGWPGDTARVFDDPEAAAYNFVVDVLGFAEPALADVTTEGNESEVVYHPNPRASITTTILVHFTGPARGWVVTGTRSSEGTIEQASFDGRAVTLSGMATAFEATVAVLVLDQQGNILAQSFTMAGANGEQGPYETTIDGPPGSGTPFWIMIAEGDESGESDLLWATTTTI
jgi:Immunoglobulin-like domain of bacterial spore germination